MAWYATHSNVGKINVSYIDAVERPGASVPVSGCPRAAYDG